MKPVSQYQRTILVALNRLGKHIYAGAESPAERAIRRRQDRRNRGLASGLNESGRDLNRAGRRLVKLADASQDRALRRAAARGEGVAA